ncbi:GNAT family N-acetyltransferase [Nocardiopsis sp. NPDC101807]|uniref:GNAT family N-acetyltransferase n=1 Tax=Nocardiopsis sp. NPDC101807 TaxID=3364339 RepID=UPI0038054113
MIEIRELPPSDEGRAAALIAEAMDSEPVMAWMIPGAEERRTLLPGLMRAFVAAALATDRVLVDGTGSALALWSHRAGPARPPREEDLRALPPAYAPHAPRIALLARTLEDRHPDGPHLYLSAIGVLPHARGRGLGSALLGHRLDGAALPAYLEAGTERSAALYARHGFAPLGAPVTLPEGPTVHPMWREPNP